MRSDAHHILTHTHASARAHSLEPKIPQHYCHHRLLFMRSKRERIQMPIWIYKGQKKKRKKNCRKPNISPKTTTIDMTTNDNNEKCAQNYKLNANERQMGNQNRSPKMWEETRINLTLYQMHGHRELARLDENGENNRHRLSLSLSLASHEFTFGCNLFL